MADTVFVVGQNGKIWHRSDTGTWSEHSIGAMGANDNFWGIHGLSANEVYAVGCNGVSGATSATWWYKWNGSTWSVWADAPSLTAGHAPTCIHCIASDDIYVGVRAAPSSATGYVIHWNGSTWTTIIDGTGGSWFRPYVIWSKSSTEVYIGGQKDFGSPIIKKWNGSTASNSTTLTLGYTIGHLYGSADGTMFCCGTDTPSYGIYRGIWDSFTLDSISSMECAATEGFAGWQDMYSYGGDAWAFGTLYNNGAIPYVAIYNGSSWTETQLKTANIVYAPVGVAGVDDHVIAVYQGYVSNNCRAFIWDGASWSEEVLGVDGSNFTPTDAWASAIPIAVDTDPPEWANLSPDDTDVNVPIDTTISIDIIDPGSGVDASTVDISVEGVYAWHNDAEQTGFSVVKTTITDGFRYVITPDTSFSSFQTVDIDVYAEDLASTPNVLDDSYYFRTVDLDDPVWANLAPNAGDTHVAVDTTISIDILDYGDGVDASTVDISVEGAYAWHNDAEQTGFSVVKTPVTNGYHYVITPDTAFDPYQTVNIDVYADDLAPTPNTLSDSYYFVTADTDPPEWANLSPDSGDIDVSLTTTISLDILDYDAGVDVDSVYIKVEGVYAWLNDTEQTGFSVVKSSITDGYRYVITPDSPFTSYQTVDIDVYAEDLDTIPNVLNDSYNFRTVDVEAPIWDNLSPDEDDINVPVDTTISLDILDYGYNIDENSVDISVEGVYAWHNNAEQTGFSVVKTTIANGYRYVITPDSSLPAYTYIDIDVYAEDLAPTPNVLNDSYSFRTADSDAPVWDNLAPNDSDINVPVDTTISLDILDYGTGVDATSVYIKVEGAYAWLNDAEQTGFSVVKSVIADGYRYVITPDSSFSSYQTVDIDVYAEDLETTPNVLNDSYSFRIVDTEAPYLTNQDPAPDDTGISPLTSIYLDVLDDGDPVDVSSVIITIDGTIAWQSDALQNGYTGSKTSQPKGYRYTLTPPSPLPMLTLIEVNVQASDTAPTPNALNTTYSFTTTTDIPPEIRNMDPANGAIDVAADKKIEFDTWDNVAIDESETVIVINSVLAYQNSSGQNSFIVTATPIVDGYHYEVTAPTNWARGTIVSVQVQVYDTLGVPATASWSFEIYGAPDCFTGPINSFEASLLVPYDMAATKLYRTEILRNLLLNRVNTYTDPIKAIRQVYLCAFNHELAPILREIVPIPTPREKTAKLCYKRTTIQIDAVLRSKPNLLSATLAELQSIGLPIPHSRMLNRYLATDEPNTLVPLACIIVLIAKALEANALS